MNSSDVRDALLQRNFFPAYNPWEEEIPPVFTSEKFTDQVARDLVALPNRNQRKYSGYDSVQYRLTKFNGLSRLCSIIHPRSYASLVLSIESNWNDLKQVSENPVSLIRPFLHDDGRIVKMDYGSDTEAIHDEKDTSFGKRWEVRTDISNFYPSFYSHSIPWALVGFEVAKAQRGHGRWFNALDMAVRNCNRGETRGVAIGPGTSLMVTEIVLEKIDRELKNEFKYLRRIDDYVAYCETEAEAEAFVSKLAELLHKYQLELNAQKTQIRKLPVDRSGWVADLTMASPDRDRMTGDRDWVTKKGAVGRFVDFAVRLADQTPDGSVLKFGLKSLIIALEDIEDPDQEIVHAILEQGLNLAFHQPVLVPVLGKLLDSEAEHVEMPQHQSELTKLLEDNIRFKRTDIVSWLLYFFDRHELSFSDEMADMIINMRDCIPLLLLYMSGNLRSQAKVVAYANSLDRNDFYEMDKHWMLLYRLFLDGRFQPNVSEKDAFEILKAADVSFVRSADKCLYADRSDVFDVRA